MMGEEREIARTRDKIERKLLDNFRRALSGIILIIANELLLLPLFSFSRERRDETNLSTNEDVPRSRSSKSKMRILLVEKRKSIFSFRRRIPNYIRASCNFDLLSVHVVLSRGPRLNLVPRNRV